MNKKVLNEVNRNRELMGISSDTLNEQIIQTIKQGISKGLEKAKDFIKNKSLKIKDKVENEIENETGKIVPEFEGILDNTLDFEVYKDYTIFKEKSYNMNLAKGMGIAGLEGLGFDYVTANNFFDGFENTKITDFEGVEHDGYYAVFKVPNKDLSEVLNID